jgi:CubicO group peptidase (beta-lactamase class C family)
MQTLIDTMVNSGAETGVQAAVYRDGDTVVDAASGIADTETGRPVTHDTLFYSASTAKAVTATIAHVLVEQGAPMPPACQASRWIPR